MTTQQINTVQDFLHNIGEIEYTLTKIDREISALCATSGPDGYACRSIECEHATARSYFSAAELTEHLYSLILRRKRIMRLLLTLKSKLREVRYTPVGAFLFYRYGKNMDIAEVARVTGMSLRTCYRVRKSAIEYVYNLLTTLPEGRAVLENGWEVLEHHYNK